MPRNSTLAILLFIVMCASALLLWAWASRPRAESSELFEAYPAGVVTFNRHVAPIVFANCAPCHRPGEAAPFPLLSYGDVKQRAGQITDVTHRRFMPPWLPKRGLVKFARERILTEQEIDLIRQWAAEGTAEGNPADLPSIPEWTEGWQLGEPDLVVTLPETYTLQADGTDVYRNFVVPSSLSSSRYVRAVEFRPGNRRVVHHAEVLIDLHQRSRRLDEQDPEPGYDGMDQGYFAVKPAGHFFIWAPGKMPTPPSDEMSWRLEAGTDFVLLMHMRPSGKPEVVKPSVGLFFTEKPPTKFPVTFRLGSPTNEIPAGKRDHVVQETFRLPVDVTVLSVFPHAHYLCRDMQGYARLPDGTRKWLIHIEDWNFDWQDEYRYASPIFLPGGTELFMRFTYDNSDENVRNPNHPPRRVLWGPNTTDEMGELWLQVLPRNAMERGLLGKTVYQADAEFRISSYEYLLRVDPENVDALNHLGSLLTQQGKYDKAAQYFERALSIEPGDAYVHNNRGLLYQRRGKLSEAEISYARAVDIDPNLATAHKNMAVIYSKRGKRALARKSLERAIRIDPDMAEAHMYLGRLQELQGESVLAKASYERAVLHAPDDPKANVYFAWLLATCNDDRVRQPAEAIRRAKYAADITARRDPIILDTLAAAYAAGGQFDRAVTVSEKALALATDRKDSSLHNAIRLRLELYKKSVSYREAPSERESNRIPKTE
jgi:tetratricopeptide (TPR) repeat protein